MSFRIQGLAPQSFAPLFGLADAELQARGARRVVVDAEQSYPDRIGLADLPLGAHALLVNHEHLPALSPYRSRHAIYVAEHAQAAAQVVDEVPAMLARRLLSVRSFDADWMMVDGEVMDGQQLQAWIAQAFADPAVRCLHVHSARRGCFLAAVERA